MHTFADLNFDGQVFSVLLMCILTDRRKARVPTWNYCFIIIEFNSGTIKIELDNTMWTVQPEQGRKG